MTFLERRGNFRQQFRTGRRDANFHDSTVLHPPNSLDQLSILQLVEHPRDVGRARYESGCELQGLKPFGLVSLQETQDVVLLGRESEPAKQFVLDNPQAVIRSP